MENKYCVTFKQTTENGKHYFAVFDTFEELRDFCTTRMVNFLYYGNATMMGAQDIIHVTHWTSTSDFEMLALGDCLDRDRIMNEL